MQLIPHDQLEAIITAAYPAVTEERKRFLVDYLDDATPARLARTLAVAPTEEADFMRACLRSDREAA